MRVYVPFFLISISTVFLIYILYNPAYDYIIKRNIYGYSKASYNVIVSNEIEIDGYYDYVDCYVESKDFVIENIGIYKKIKDCSVDVLKVNTLAKYYNDSQVLMLIEYDFDYMLINETNYKAVVNYVTHENFVSGNLDRYLNFDGEKVVLNVNLNHDLKEYIDFEIVYKIDNVSVVNKFNKLDSYNNSLSYCMGYYVYSQEMCDDFRAFIAEISQSNITYNIGLVFDKSDLFSEHATGLAIDIEYDNNYENVMEEIASRYGFILRYKSDYFNVCNYEEMMHFRYVGLVSLDIYKMQISLEEYVYLYG